MKLLYKEKVKQLLHERYSIDGIKIAPFSLPKMNKLIDSGETYYMSEYDCYYVIDNNYLVLYLSPDNICHIPTDVLNQLGAISLPEYLFDQMKDDLIGFDIESGWLLTYDFGYIPPPITDNSYTAVDFDFGSEADYQCAADILGGGKSSWLTADGIREITESPAFDPSLWFFVCENDEKIAVNISSYVKEIRETILNWVAALPDYQGKGAGRFLVNELITRCKEKSDVICVGGTVEFYRRCGFVDNTLWYRASKPDYEFK